MEYIIEKCTEGDADYIIDRLVEYNLSQVPAQQKVLFDTFDKKITDDNRKIIAGCVARMYCWNVAYVDTLWVDSKHCGKGLGSQLLTEVERTAKEKGCYLIHLDTFDFQAKEFYEKHGYKVFGTLEDCPKEHCRYYLMKKIYCVLYAGFNFISRVLRCVNPIENFLRFQQNQEI